MNFKVKMLKNIISVLCATVIATSGVVTSVGAIDYEKVSQILKNINDCDNSIKDLEKNKEIINEQTENEIKKLDSEIKGSEQLLEYLIQLIEDGEPQKGGADNVKRGIEDNKQKKEQISADRDREINDLNQKTEIAKTAKAKLEKELKDLLKEEKEKFVLEKNNAFRVLGEYKVWLKDNKLNLASNNSFEQLKSLLAQARAIEKAAKFDAKEASEIVEKLGVAVKDVEKFKKEFEAKKANEAREKEAEEKQEKEKLVLEKNNAMEELTNYAKWLKQNGLPLNYNDLHNQLLKSAIKAEKIADAAKFDAEAAREIVAKLGVVLKDIEEFKKDFEAKKANKDFEAKKANRAKDALHKKDMGKLLDAIKAAAKKKQEQERKKFFPKMHKAQKECVDYLKWLNQNYLFPYDPEDNNLRNRLVKLSEIARQMAMAPKFDAKEAHKILEELDVVLKDVEEFKKDFEANKEAKEKQEKEKFVLKIDNAVKEFMNYGDWLKQNGLSPEGNDLYNQLSKLAFEARTIEKADKFDVKAARKIVAELGYAVKGVEKFKKDFEAKKKDSVEKIQSVWRGHIVRGKVKKQEKAAMNITDDKFKELLAGDQNVGNKKVVDGQEWKIENTCGVHMLTTLKNIYDYMDGKKGGPVKGFNNVIDNYLANGGTTDRLFKPNKRGTRLGAALNSSDFKGFLEKNKIGMQRFDFFQGINVKEEAEKANKQEWDVVQEHKDKLKNQIKSFLISYMKGKNFAPIGTVGGGHWALLAKYDEKTNKILRLDSSPAEAEWVDIDKIAGNFISRPYSFGGGNYGLNFEMPIFTRTEGIKDVQLDSDSFAEQKQNELIKKIG